MSNNVGLLLVAAVLLVFGYLYHRVEMLEMKNAQLRQQQIDYIQYQNGSAQANAQIVDKYTALVKEVNATWSSQVLDEIKANKEEIRSISRAVAVMQTVQQAGPSTDTGKTWDYKDEYLEASVVKDTGWFSYKIYPVELGIDVLETTTTDESSKLRIQVTDLRNDALLKVTDYDVKYPATKSKELKVPLFSNKWVKVSLLAGAFVAGILVAK